MNIGLIGAGAVGQLLLNELKEKKHEHLRIKSVLVRDKKKYDKLVETYDVKLFTDLERFLDSNIDIVVEVANIDAVKTMLPSILKKKEAVLLSVGALADESLLTEITELIHMYNHHVHLPSGAVGGLDLLQNAQSLGVISDVTLTTRKPANSLIEEDIQEANVIFEGKAIDAIKRFPKNMNVSIVLSLAGIGMEKTNVSIIADPHIDKNEHHIEIKGDFGEATISITNNPLPENPKTSYLAAMSMIGTLERMENRLRIGV